jgi:hypothetical protein
MHATSLQPPLSRFKTDCKVTHLFTAACAHADLARRSNWSAQRLPGRCALLFHGRLHKIPRSESLNRTNHCHNPSSHDKIGQWCVRCSMMPASTHGLPEFNGKPVSHCHRLRRAVLCPKAPQSSAALACCASRGLLSFHALTPFSSSLDRRMSHCSLLFKICTDSLSRFHFQFSPVTTKIELLFSADRSTRFVMFN